MNKIFIPLFMLAIFACSSCEKLESTPAPAPSITFSNDAGGLSNTGLYLMVTHDTTVKGFKYILLRANFAAAAGIESISAKSDIETKEQKEYFTRSTYFNYEVSFEEQIVSRPLTRTYTLKVTDLAGQTTEKLIKVTVN